MIGDFMTKAVSGVHGIPGAAFYAYGGGVEYAAKAARPRRGEQGKKPPLLDCAGPKRSIASRQPALRARHVVWIDFFYKKIIKISANT